MRASESNGRRPASRDGAPEPAAPANGASAVDSAEPVEEIHSPVAVFGGVYSNHLALEAVLEDARARGADRLFCLGDLGAFGPHPDRVFPLLVDAGVRVIRGNYDDSIARGLEDCRCGYTDPRDNHFAHLSYRYTFARTSGRWRRWMAGLPSRTRIRLGDADVLMCHGSPRRMNEFLWESTTSTAFLTWLADTHAADVMLATHTGLHWKRDLPRGRLFANAGVIGRPANDGRTEVWYALLRPRRHTSVTGASPPDDPPVELEFVPVAYDHERLAAEMRSESLPEEFVDTILTGWWTTCLEVLPAKERARGRF